MKFLLSREAEVPAAFAFGLASDFISHELRAARAGLDVRMLTGLPVGQGSRWQVAGMMRGKYREALIEVLTLDAPNQFTVLTVSGGITLHSRISFVVLTRRLCRIETETEVKPNNLRARLLINAMRLIRPRIVKRLRRALTRAAAHLELLYRDEDLR